MQLIFDVSDSQLDPYKCQVKLYLNNKLIPLNFQAYFLDKEDSHVKGEGGLLKTGQWYILGVQLLGCVCISVWTIGTSFLLLKVSGSVLMGCSL